MKQLIHSMGVLFVCSAMGTAAFAGTETYSGKEMKQVVPAPLPECNWTGFYIGLNVGGQFGHSEDKDLDRTPVFGFWNEPNKPWGYSESGVVGGGQVGYNYQWNWVVLGVEADGGYMNVDGSGREPNHLGHTDTRGSTDSDFYTTVRGRLGIALNTWMLYATGGGIGLNYEQRVFDNCNTGPTCGGGEIDAHRQDFNWGWTVGGGIEKMLGCHWSIKTEYLFFDIDREGFSGVATAGGATGSRFFFNGDTTGHIVRAGLNYKF
jgi:outer membrane immunogenic protein